MTVANVNVTKVLMKRGNTAQNAAYTGVNGEVVVDLQAKTLRIHDGSTLGGFVITAGGVIGAYSNTNTAAYLESQNITSANIGGSQTFANTNAAVQATAISSLNANIGTFQTFANTNAATQSTSINNINANLGAFQTYANATFGTSSYANANVKSYLAAFDGNIIPSANVTYSLGNITHQWRDLWVSNNTIYIGNTPIRVDGGTLLVNNAPITAGSTYGNANVATYLSRGNVTVGNITIQDEFDQQWQFRNGALIWPAGDGTPTGPSIDGSSNMLVTIMQGGDFEIYTTQDITGNTRSWTFNSVGNLIVPDDATIWSDLDLRLYAEAGNIALGNQNGTWMFDSDGRFTAPGDVYGQYFTLRGGNSHVNRNGVTSANQYDAGGGGGFILPGVYGTGANVRPGSTVTGSYGQGGWHFLANLVGGLYSTTYPPPSTSSGGFGGGGGPGPITGGGGGGYSGGGGSYSNASTAIDSGGGGGSWIAANATAVATSDGQYERSNTFGSESITNLATVNAGPGYVRITKV